MQELGLSCLNKRGVSIPRCSCLWLPRCMPHVWLPLCRETLAAAVAVFGIFALAGCIALFARWRLLIGPLMLLNELGTYES